MTSVNKGRFAMQLTCRAVTTVALAAWAIALVWSPTRATAADDSKAPAISQRVLDFTKPVPVEGDELHKKLAERHNAAAELLDARVEEYKKGVCDLNAVMDAARLAVDAKYDVADSDDARMRVLEDTLEVAKMIEDRARQVMEKGLGSKADYQKARLGRLSVEVAILKAKRGEKLQ
jgi:hypothetical protein